MLVPNRTSAEAPDGALDPGEPHGDLVDRTDLLHEAPRLLEQLGCRPVEVPDDLSKKLCWLRGSSPLVVVAADCGSEALAHRSTRQARLSRVLIPDRQGHGYRPGLARLPARPSFLEVVRNKRLHVRPDGRLVRQPRLYVIEPVRVEGDQNADLASRRVAGQRLVSDALPPLPGSSESVRTGP